MEGLPTEPLFSPEHFEEIRKNLKKSNWMVGFFEICRWENATEELKDIVWEQIQAKIRDRPSYELKENQETIRLLQIKALSIADQNIMGAYNKFYNLRTESEEVDEIRKKAKRIINKF